jgi:hypothetical protein
VRAPRPPLSGAFLKPRLHTPEAWQIVIRMGGENASFTRLANALGDFDALFVRIHRAHVPDVGKLALRGMRCFRTACIKIGLFDGNVKIRPALRLISSTIGRDTAWRAGTSVAAGSR